MDYAKIAITAAGLDFSFRRRHKQVCKIRNPTIIQCFAPINDADEEIKLALYERLQEVLDMIPSRNILLLTGDFNAKVDADKGEELVMSIRGTGIRNENGELLIFVELCEANELVIGGTLCSLRALHKNTGNHRTRKLDRPQCNIEEVEKVIRG